MLRAGARGRRRSPPAPARCPASESPGAPHRCAAGCCARAPPPPRPRAPQQRPAWRRRGGAVVVQLCPGGSTSVPSLSSGQRGVRGLPQNGNARSGLHLLADITDWHHRLCRARRSGGPHALGSVVSASRCGTAVHGATIPLRSTASMTATAWRRTAAAAAEPGSGCAGGEAGSAGAPPAGSTSVASASTRSQSSCGRRRAAVLRLVAPLSGARQRSTGAKAGAWEMARRVERLGRMPQVQFAGSHWCALAGGTISLSRQEEECPRAAEPGRARLQDAAGDGQAVALAVLRRQRRRGAPRAAALAGPALARLARAGALRAAAIAALRAGQALLFGLRATGQRRRACGTACAVLPMQQTDSASRPLRPANAGLVGRAVDTSAAAARRSKIRSGPRRALSSSARLASARVLTAAGAPACSAARSAARAPGASSAPGRAMPR